MDPKFASGSRGGGPTKKSEYQSDNREYHEARRSLALFRAGKVGGSVGIAHRLSIDPSVTRALTYETIR